MAQLKEFNPKSLCFDQLPVHYEPKASCPNFVKFLNSLFATDSDKEQKIMLLQEMMGLTLLPDNTIESFFVILVGKAGSGKSKFLELLRLFFGDENVSAVSLNMLSNQFHAAHLHGKLVNITTELPVGVSLPESEIKTITSGDLLNAAHKNKPPFDFNPTCKIWLSTNHMPHTRDYSDGIFRRAKIIQFNGNFIGENGDPNILESIIPEFSGILNFAIEGLLRFLKAKKFTSCASSQTLLESWKTDIDQVREFVDENCILSDKLSVKSSSIFSSYRSWAEKNNIRMPLRQKSFSIRLREAFSLTIEQRNDANHFLGLSLKH